MRILDFYLTLGRIIMPPHRMMPGGGHIVFTYVHDPVRLRLRHLYQVESCNFIVRYSTAGASVYCGHISNKNLSWWIEKCVLRVTVWHHEACRVTSDCSPEGRIFLFIPHIHDRFFFLHTFHFWNWAFDNAVTSIADVLHIVMTIPWRLVTSFRSLTLTLTMTSWRPI